MPRDLAFEPADGVTVAVLAIILVSTSLNAGGTPHVAFAITAAMIVLMIFSGSFEFVFRLMGALIIFGFVIYDASLFRLRWTQPDLPHPFRAIGYPVLPALVLLIDTALLIAFIAADPTSGLTMAALIALCIPVGIVLHRKKKPNTKQEPEYEILGYLPRPSTRSRLYRGVGAVFLLRDAIDAGAAHGAGAFPAGAVENVVGMAAYRSALEAVLGPLSAQALAGQTFGFYAGLVYFTPLIGGWVADRWLGAKKTVVVGVLLMTAGHAAMVFDQSFLLALLLLILGSGALKGNIAAQVGQLYAVQDARRTTAFAVFSLSINVGAIFGPLVCGLLAQIYGWHYGFGAAGLLMLMALCVYLKGLRHFPEERPVRRDR